MPEPRLVKKLPRPLKKRLKQLLRRLWELKHRIIFTLCSRRGAASLGSYRCAPIGYLDQQPPLRTLAPAQAGSVFAPRRAPGQAPHRYSVPTPAINLYRFDSALISPVSSHIITERSVILERLPHLEPQQCNYATGAIVRHDAHHALYRRRPPQPIQQGLFIGGNGAGNYYHWLTEILPKLSEACRHGMLNQYTPLLVPDYAQHIPALADSLQAVLGEQHPRIIYLEPQRQYRVQRLYTLTSPNCILFNPRRLLASPDYNYYRKESLQAVREAILERLHAYDPERLRRQVAQLGFEQKGRRLYLARKPGTNRAYNQTQVRRLLVEQHHYCAVYLEDHPLELQAWLFANASTIVGASGAAWANLIFCRPGTRAISWLPEHLMAFSAYSTLAELFGVEMEFIAAKSPNTRQLHPDHTLPLDELAQRLEYVSRGGCLSCQAQQKQTTHSIHQTSE